MKLVKICAASAVLVGAYLISATGNATVLYNNLGASSEGTDTASGFGPLYDSFSTGGAVTLTDISLLLNASDPADGGTFTISLYNDSSTSPGSFIGSSTFNDFLLSSSLGVFSEATSFSLSADTRYWIGLSSTGTTDWSFSADISGPGVAGEFFANQDGVFPNSEAPYQMELTGSTSSVVPEPSTWAMMAIGFAGLGFLGFRSAKQRRFAVRVAQI